MTGDEEHCHDPEERDQGQRELPVVAEAIPARFHDHEVGGCRVPELGTMLPRPSAGKLRGRQCERAAR